VLDELEVRCDLDVPTDGIAAVGEGHLPVQIPVPTIHRGSQLEGGGGQSAGRGKTFDAVASAGISTRCGALEFDQSDFRWATLDNAWLSCEPEP